MKWHTNITIGDLHYLRSKFAERQGSDGIYLGSFNKSTEAFFHSKQFRVNDNYFLTWAFLEPEWEVNYFLDKFDWLDHCQTGYPWIIEAYMPDKALSAMKELRNIIPGNNLRYRTKDGHRRIKIP